MKLQTKDGIELKVGDMVTTFRGERVKLAEFNADRNRVYCVRDGIFNEWFPSVINAKFED